MPLVYVIYKWNINWCSYIVTSTKWHYLSGYILKYILRNENIKVSDSTDARYEESTW